MHRRRKVGEKSGVSPAGTSNKLDVQNKEEENTHTHIASTGRLGGSVGNLETF